MTINNLDDLAYYIFLNEYAINSLYNQISKSYINKKVTRQFTSKDIMNGDINANLGIIKSKVSGDIEELESYIIETQYDINIERKLNKLLEGIRAMGIDEAINVYGHPFTKAHLVHIQDSFNLSYIVKDNQYLDNIENIMIPKENCVIIFQYGNTERNNEFQCGDISSFGVDMCFNSDCLKKKFWSIHHSSIKRFYLFNVFGILVYCGKNYYSLEPFAVWL